MTNKERLYNIRAKVIRSVYWSEKLKNYYESSIYRYGPMIKDNLFKVLFDGKAVVGVIAMEEALGSPFKVEELEVCPLSVEYLTLGEVIVTESEEERLTLESFEALIDEKIRKEEGRATARLIKKLEGI